MDQFIERMRRAHATRGADSAHALSNRAAKALLTAFEIVPEGPRDDITLDWFIEKFPGFPVYLGAERLGGHSIENLFHRPFSSPAWQAYVDARRESAYHAVGVIVTLATSPMFVIHDLAMPENDGEIRLVMKKEPHLAYFESFKSFLTGIKKSWTP